MTAPTRRAWLIALSIGSALAISLVLIYFIALPKLIENQIEEVFAKIYIKTERQLSVDKLKLAGTKSIVLTGLKISDFQNPQSNAIHIDKIKIKLDRIPTGKDFRIEEVQIYDGDIALRYDGQKTNYDDLLEQLKSKPTSTTSGPASNWKSYITPLPILKIKNLRIDMPSVDVKGQFKMVELQLIKLQTKRNNANEAVDIEGLFSLKLDENGHQNSYNLPLTGQLKSLKELALTLPMPQTSEGKRPDAFSLAGYEASYESMTLELPTTLRLKQAKLSLNDKEIIHIQELRTQFMTLPPKKVSGIYFKEIEVNRPKLELSYLGKKLPLQDLQKAMRETWLKGEHDTVVLPKERPTPRDHFFTQRLFINDAQIAIHDSQAKARPSLVIDKLSLELGYRSIRKCIDYQLEIESSNPIQGQVHVEGRYTLKNESVWTKIHIPYAKSSSALNAWLKEQESLENLPLSLRLLQQFDFKNADLTLDLDLEYDVPKDHATLKGKTTCKGFEINNDSISALALPINTEIILDAEAKPAEKYYKLKQLDILVEDAKLTLSGALTKQEIETNKKNHSTVNTWSLDADIEIPQQNAQQLFEAVPQGLRHELDGLNFQGTAGFKLSLSGNLAQISKFKHQIKLELSEDFDVTNWPIQRNIESLNHAFIHDIRDPNALNPHQSAIPPSIYPIIVDGEFRYMPSLEANDIRLNYPDWVLFEDLNPWLIQLITTTEDGSFFSHHGFSPLQIKAALEKNIIRKTFYRGASTLSMQLIKNLYFDRSKSIARKFQETLYTWLLETVVQIPKQRIMELYFNLIEFGPEIYGIQEAAKYYFGKKSADLTLKESAFLMAIIPNPRRGELYRNQTLSEKRLSRTIDFYIREMIRRKCKPETLEAMRERYRKRDIPMPYAPCCPREDSLQLMRESTLSFHLPNPSDLLQYELREDLYGPDGEALTPMLRSSCQNHMSPEIGSIFESLNPDEMPLKDDLF